MADAAARIAILAVPESSAGTVYSMRDLFCSAGQEWQAIVQGEPGSQLIEPLIVTRDGRPLPVNNGITIHPEASLAECPHVEVVCMPEVNVMPGDWQPENYAAEIDWLRRRFEAGTTLAASCSGAVMFAEAGLLDDSDATTHWAWTDAMRARYPRVRLREQQALVTCGEGQRIIMAGGGTSWLDLALYLIARLVGVDVAMQVARVNLIDWHRVGQQPYASLVCSRQVTDAAIAKCQTWIAHNYDQAAPVSAMVKLSGLAERTFKRRFKQATGMSPIEYVHALRLEEAKQMLEAGSLSVEAIAGEVGYEDPGYFGRLFRRKVNLTPAQYRKRFGSLRERLVQA